MLCCWFNDAVLPAVTLISLKVLHWNHCQNNSLYSYSTGCECAFDAYQLSVKNAVWHIGLVWQAFVKSFDFWSHRVCVCIYVQFFNDTLCCLYGVLNDDEISPLFFYTNCSLYVDNRITVWCIIYCYYLIVIVIVTHSLMRKNHRDHIQLIGSCWFVVRYSSTRREYTGTLV